LSAVELAVIGAGPAGVAAAHEASSRGGALTIVDDNPVPGRQYFGQGASDSLRRIAGAIFDGRVRVDHRPDSCALGFFESERSVVSGGRATTLNSRCTIDAAGCTERPAPFPGWTLPGVIGGTLETLKTWMATAWRIKSRSSQPGWPKKFAAFGRWRQCLTGQQWSLLGDDTIVCRCEDAVAAELRAASGEGVTKANSLKTISRVSMGAARAATA